MSNQPGNINLASVRAPPKCPINLKRWLADNESTLLKPPVNNYCLYDEKDFTVMVIGGPNQREDYHINCTEEWFFQIKGDMKLHIVDINGAFTCIDICEGEMYLLPGNIPHNPVRFKDTVGLVLERKRPEGSLDYMRWYCQKCKEIVWEDAFHCTNLGQQLKPVIEKYMTTTELRKCSHCQHQNEYSFGE